MSEENISVPSQQTRDWPLLTPEELDQIAGGVQEQLHKGFNEEERSK